MQRATLCFPVIGDPAQQVWLGLKKFGFGAGKITGIGGKIEARESAIESAVRELYEEVGLIAGVESLKAGGQIDFFFPAKPAWDLTVFVFVIRQWDGSPIESDEIEPHLFAVEQLPFERMWTDAQHWLPLVLTGKTISAQFTFATDNETLSMADVRIVS